MPEQYPPEKIYHVLRLDMAIANLETVIKWLYSFGEGEEDSAETLRLAVRDILMVREELGKGLPKCF